MVPSEFSAGPNQMIVVYVSSDTGTEVDPAALYGEIAQDAARRAESGHRIVSMAAVPVRHTGAFLARQGSGYESKIAVAVIYAAA
jgi:hypothetical protein